MGRTMASLHLRNVDDELMKRLRHEAIESEVTLREYVLAILNHPLLNQGEPPKNLRKPARGAKRQVVNVQANHAREKTDPEKIPGVTRGPSELERVVEEIVKPKPPQRMDYTKTW